MVSDPSHQAPSDNQAVSPGAFPPTRLSVVRALGDSDAEVRERAFATLVAAYWKPVYKYIRLRWNENREDAEDFTQEFFSAALEKQFLQRYDPSKARFRTFLRTCIDRTILNARQSSRREKRGGNATIISVDFLTAEDELHATDESQSDMEEFFRQEWVRALFELAVERLRAECRQSGKTIHFELFERYDLDGMADVRAVTYGELARRYELPETQVTNYLAFARRRFRYHVMEVLTELTSTDDETAAEARDLFGIE